VHELEEVAESIECAGMERLYAAAPRAGAKAEILRDGRMVALCLEGVKDTMLARAFGVGLHEPATREGVEACLSWFRDHDTGPFLVHASPSARPAELRDWLVASGLRPHRAWMKFARERAPVKRPTSELVVRRGEPEHDRAFADIACEMFHLPEGSRALIATMVALEGWHAFLSFLGETPAGIGALFVRDGVGWLGFGATKPEFQGRGGQAAVLAARLEAAFDLGCRVVITETGVAASGDPQHSYKNILKAGFRELYVRDNFVGGTSPS
jgi:GNAT superfamily N-acetyltransferase